MEALLENDVLGRTVVLWALAVAATIFLAGGLFARVGGSWRVEDGTVWELGQLGPWVRGKAVVPGGEQRLRGTVWFGHLWLTRRSWGLGHLVGLGFARDEAARVDGQITASFHLRRRGPHLWAGTFVGRSFRFAADGSYSVALGLPEPRRIERVG